jgi:NAD(P)H dehydrogenase (quinone)
MIVVTGATGQLGQSVIENLLKRVPADQIVASVRDPDKAGAYLADKGVKVRRGDFSDPASLKIAFARADQVLIVSADKLGEEALRLYRSRCRCPPRSLYQPYGRAAPLGILAGGPACGNRGRSQKQRLGVHGPAPRLLCRKLHAHYW